MKIRPLGSSILFTFTDKVVKSGGMEHFVPPSTASGIVVLALNIDEQAKKPRWAKVVAIGPQVKEVCVDEYILITPLRWTTGIVFEGTKIWKTDEKEVLMASEEVHYD